MKISALRGWQIVALANRGKKCADCACNGSIPGLRERENGENRDNRPAAFLTPFAIKTISDYYGGQIFSIFYEMKMKTNESIAPLNAPQPPPPLN